MYVGMHVMSVQQLVIPKGRQMSGLCILPCLGVSAIQSSCCCVCPPHAGAESHFCIQGYIVTRSQSSRQSEARTNHILQNLNTDGLPGFGREWASRHQGRLPGQAHQGYAGSHSPGILDIPSERVHAAFNSRTHGGR